MFNFLKNIKEMVSKEKKVVIFLIIFVFAYLIEFAIKNLYFKNDYLSFSLLGFGGVLVILFIFFLWPGKVESMPSFEYKDEKWYIILLKVLNINFLVTVSYLFLSKHELFFAFVFLLASLVQLFFIYRLKSANIHPVANRNFVDYKFNNKYNLFFVVVIIITFFSLLNLKNGNFFYGMLCFLPGLVVIRFSDVGNRAADAEAKNVNMDYFYLFIISVIAFLVFSYKLDLIPYNLDERFALNNSRQIHGIFPDKILFGDPAAYSTFFAFFGALVSAFKGLSMESLRMVNVIAGVIFVAFSFLFTKRAFGRKEAYVAAFLNTFYYMILVYSRIGSIYMFNLTFTMIVLYFLIKAIKEGHIKDYVFCGAFLGLNMYAYFASYIMPVIVFFFGIYMIFYFGKKQIRQNIFLFTIVFVAALITFFPLLYTFYTNSLGTAHFRSSSLLSGNGNLLQEYMLILKKLRVDIMSFFWQSQDYAYNFPIKPLFDGILGFFVLLGLGIGIVFVKKPAYMLLLLMLAFSFVPELLGRNVPEGYVQRYMLAFIPLIIFASISFAELWRRVERYNKKNFIIIPILITVVLGSIFIFSNMKTYFVEYIKQPSIKNVSFYALSKVEKEMNSKNQVNFVSPAIRNMTGFGAPIYKVEYTQLDISLFEINKLYNAEGKDAVIITEGTLNKMLNSLLEYFPDAKIERIWDVDYKKQQAFNYFKFNDLTEPALYFVSCRIPASDIAKIFGMKVTFTGNNPSETRVVNSQEIEFGTDTREITVNCLLEAPIDGSYNISVRGAKNYSIYIDGRPFNNGTRLYKGLHKFKVIAATNGSGKIYFEWEAADGIKREKISVSNLIASSNINGLIASYYDMQGKFIQRQLEPVVDYQYYFYTWRVKNHLNSFTTKWDGYVNIKEDGKYEFAFSSDYNCSVNIDGANACTYKDYKGGTKTLGLKKGKHRISVVFDFYGTSQNRMPTSYARLLYKVNNNIFTPVTYDMLTPE